MLIAWLIAIGAKLSTLWCGVVHIVVWCPVLNGALVAQVRWYYRLQLMILMFTGFELQLLMDGAVCFMYKCWVARRVQDWSMCWH